MDWWAPKLGVILEMLTQGGISRTVSAIRMTRPLGEQ